ncbi:MAG: cobalt transporter CbiM [Clostridiales Family XIII bacterium]|jgi:cobalt/nickel transport system permease protein|nr:cobalt transporter CbiM [Clostridiales Family XIII bacterium]
MHIPENYLSPETCAVMGAAMIPVLVVAVKKVKEEISKEKLPLLGVGAAFSFLMMMFNIPLPGGTTGHAVGAVLIAVLLGPYAATLSVTVALAIQALLFGDGGVLALGANCFNMAFVMPFVGYAVYKLFKDHTKSTAGTYAGVIAGSYIGLNAAAFVAAIEFGIQPLLFTNEAGQALYCPYPLSISVPAMLIPHLLAAGVVEALFTVFIYTFIRKASPGILYAGEKTRTPALYGLIAALIALVPLGLLAAGTAWGEWSGDEISGVVTNGGALGYVPGGMENGFELGAVMPDYSIAGLPEVFGYILSAICGVAIAIILFRLIAALKKGTGAARSA